jgi:cyclopropane fatty-acyl-phospholipid synthase-like methyltransferase
MGIIDKKDDAYSLNEKVTPFLGRNDLFSYEGYLQHVMSISGRWAALSEVIQTGKPAIEKRDPEFFVPLTRALFAVNWQEAQELYDVLKKRSPVKILDIGAGACPWSLPFVISNKEAHVTAIDLPPVIDGSTKPTLKELGFLERFTFYSGNFWDLSWGNSYDLIIVGHICHMLDREANIALFQKVRNALDSQGVLAMIDYVADEQRRERLFPLLFAVNMLINTDGGDVYTFSEFKEMLSYAGFKEFSLIHLNEGQGGDVVLASL